MRREKLAECRESSYVAVAVNKNFWLILAGICGAYLAFWGAMLATTATYTSPLAITASGTVAAPNSAGRRLGDR